MDTPIKNQTAVLLPVLALGHGLNDFIAGFLLAHADGQHSVAADLSIFTLYSIIAFGGQVPLAFFIERKADYRSWALAGFVLMTWAVIMSSWNNMAAILVSGIASAIYHVAGGALSIRVPKKQSIGAGFFSAPGVVGLALGGFLVSRTSFSLWWLLPVLAIFALLVYRFGKTELLPEPDKKEKTTGFDWHDAIMLLLLLIIALRSAVWDIFQLVYYSDPSWMLWIALAAAGGKMFGGFMAERFSKVNYLGTSLLGSITLLQFSEKHPVFLLGGIALLQSTLPACLILFNRMLGNQPGMANAVVLGLAVVLGAFPYQFPETSLFYWICGTLVFLMLGFWLLRRKIRFPV